jgi:hypothetical protein
MLAPATILRGFVDTLTSMSLCAVVLQYKASPVRKVDYEFTALKWRSMAFRRTTCISWALQRPSSV